MELLGIIQTILSLFGAAIFVPIVVFIISVLMGVDKSKAFRGSLFMGIGLTAFSIILSGLTSSLGPLVDEMVKNSGINLPVIDIGWPAAAAICYANYIGLFFIPFGIGIDTILYLIGWTDTFHPTDVWNYYFFIFWAALVQINTGSFVLGIFAGILANLFLLLLSDWIAPAIECYYGYEGLTCTDYASINSIPFTILIKYILEKLGLLKRININPDSLKEKLGFWGEPVTIGLIIGAFVGIVARWSMLGDADSWATILKSSLTTGAVMALYPSVSGLFVKGLIPITTTLNTRIRSGKMKRKNMYISIDPAVYFGETATMATGIALIPVALAAAILLPGNTMLPLSDLPALPFMCIGIVVVMKGNIFGSIITGALWLIMGQYINTEIAPLFTIAAENANAISNLSGTATMVTSLQVGGNPVCWIIYKAFTAPENVRILAIGAVIVLYFIVYFLFQKNRKKWQIAAGANEEYFIKKEELWNEAQQLSD